MKTKSPSSIVLFFACCALCTACSQGTDSNTGVISDDDAPHNAAGAAGSPKDVSGAESTVNPVLDSSDAKAPPNSPNSKSESRRQSYGWKLLPAQAENLTPHKVITRSAIPTGLEKGQELHLEIDGDHISLPDRPWLEPESAKFRRTFAMEQTDFLPGEPILVRFAIELTGDGEWTISDYNYWNNRDETIVMLLRDQQGNWIEDRYRYPEIGAITGGTIDVESFSEKNPEIHWLPVQQYRAIEGTGTFDLFCIKIHCWSSMVSGFPPSPLLAVIPPDVIERARRCPVAEVDYATDYAHFSIRIANGSEAEQTKMIERWSKVVASDDRLSPHRGKANATMRSWEHSLRNDFIPFFRPWWQSTYDETKESFTLMQLSQEYERWVDETLTRSQTAELMPKMIAQLTAADDRSRSTAEFYLREWTGKNFGHTWEGHRFDRPTLEEGRAMQELWRQWWKENETKFSSAPDRTDRGR